MSRHNRERRRHGGERQRVVTWGVVPDTSTRARVGVSVGWEDDRTHTAIIPADEARTMALKLETADPETAKRLRAMANELPRMTEEIRKGGLGVAIVDPTITGPEALREWAVRWRDLFRATYQEALARGYPPDTVVWTTPVTESLDDPPVAFDLRSPEEAQKMLVRFLPSAKRPTAMPGTFFIIASRAEGRFKGTFTGRLSMTDDKSAMTPENN